MSLFLVSFFLLYGGMHGYLIVKARNAFDLGAGAIAPMVLFALLMICAPFIAHLSERSGHAMLALAAAWAGYVWLGLLFLFLCGSLLIDMAGLLVRFAVWAGGWDTPRIANAVRLHFCLAGTVAILITCYGFVEARVVRTERVVVETDKLAEGAPPIRIVQISDVHLGLMVGESRLRGIIDGIKRADPDLLVCTGDLLDGETDGLTHLARLFNEIEPPYGKFAITGNHEFYAGLAHFMAFAGKAGFTVLRGERADIAGVMTIAGVDDIAGMPSHLARVVDERDLLPGPKERLFTLLLKHRPLVDRRSVGHFDLQLSGHTHKGQIFPFTLVVRAFFPFTAGRFDLGANSVLYVSRGTGTWGPPIRFLAPPEITLIEVRPRGRAAGS